MGMNKYLRIVDALSELRSRLLCYGSGLDDEPSDEKYNLLRLS